MCPLTIAAVGMAAVGAGTSVVGGLQGAAAAKSAAQANSRMESLKAARERTTQIRNARAARAEIQQKGANQNATGSSVTTGASGVSMQAAGNIQYLGYEEQTGQALSTARQKELDAEGVKAIGGGISDMAGTIFQNRKEIGGLFGDPAQQ